MKPTARISSWLAVVAVVGAACSPQSIESPTTAEPPEPASTTTTATSPPTDAGPSTTTSPTTTEAGTVAPTTIVPVVPTARLAVRDIWVFPGPDVYAGDRLTFQVPVGGFDEYALIDAEIAVDGAVLDTEAILSGDPLIGGFLIFGDAFDTGTAVGGHWVDVTAHLDPGLTLELRQHFVVGPAASRPAQELTAAWASRTTECCELRFLTGTAAERDIDEIAADLEELFRLDLPRVRIVLIDTLWGNGGYAGSEVVLSYLDRDYTPGRAQGFGGLVRHELTHAITDQLERSTPWPLAEGAAVFAAGGHYKSEPLGARAAALREMGALPTLARLFEDFREIQHEHRYVAVGAFVAYVVERFGWEAFVDLYDEDIDADWRRWLNRASRRVLGEDLAALQVGFDAWLDGMEVGDQAIDLELTVSLQIARRRYQLAYAPYPSYLMYGSVTDADQPALAMREGRTPELAAVEAMIAAGQRAIAQGRFDDAGELVAAVELVVETGRISGGLPSEYLGVALALSASGLELVEVEISGAEVTAVAGAGAPEVTLVRLQRAPRGWALVP